MNILTKTEVEFFEKLTSLLILYLHRSQDFGIERNRKLGHEKADVYLELTRKVVIY